VYKEEINENRKIVHANGVYKAEINEIRWMKKDYMPMCV
jgi:hypothetical protein